MSTIKLNGNGFGGVVQGAFGTYQAASDGSFTVDTRDAPSCLALGMEYVTQFSGNYTTPLAPAAAGVGAIVASGALSNGTVAVTAQPEVPRQVSVEVGTGTTAITAGSVAVTYLGNDGLSGTDTFSLVCTASASVTQFLSRGCVSISSVAVSGVVGGLSPWFRMSRTSMLAVPVPPGAIDIAFTREYDGGATGHRLRQVGIGQRNERRLAAQFL